MSRVVIVSNRVPLASERTAQAGGLAVALADGVPPGALWFGWSGRRSAEPDPPAMRSAGGVTYATIDLTPAEYRTYYLGFANSALYPLLLYRLGLATFRTEDYEGYVLVNARFAATLVPLLRPDDLVWIHDYHLLCLPAELRARGVTGRIGFFLHTPFVPPALLAVLPRAGLLLDALCAADVLGFQTATDRANFAACAVQLLGATHLDEAHLLVGGRRLHLIVAPAGIDAAGFAAMARRAAHETPARRLRESLDGRALALSVDRLDHTKGLPQRAEAIGRLFERHPGYRRQVSFLQIAAVSREEVASYQRLRRDLDQAVGEVNGRYAEPDWTPLRYMTRATARPTLAGFHRLARIGLVTPLRDGMNLVAKEYVAAQDPDDPGVLVLSPFAGAAETMTTALMVNPFDADAVVATLDTALRMDLAERRQRHAELRAVVTRDCARAFCERFLAALAAVAPPPLPLALPAGAA